MARVPVVRYVLITLSVLVTLHYILSFSSETYSQRTSLLRPGWLLDRPTRSYPPPSRTDYDPTHTGATNSTRVNAAFVVLARNSDLQGILGSIKQMEDRFNKRYHYPYVFLNEEAFSNEFKQLVSEVTSTPPKFGKIPKNHWVQPPWIDEKKAARARQEMKDKEVIYGDSVPYRNMCRFNSGFFFRHELLKDYDYYWRIEPDVKFFCDIDYDPFLVMKEQKKVYGFTLTFQEYASTIATLWDTTKEFMKDHPEYLPKDNALSFISDDKGESYNLCHFWSNFEIGDLNFWRGVPYMKYFEYLDAKGGFYYERWGDAPVHSIGAALFASKSQIHFFDDIGYRHEPFQHCPQGEAHARGKCWCDQKDNVDREWFSCLTRWEKALDN